MPGEVRYRRARQEDLTAIGEVFLAAFPESVEHYVGRPVGPLVMADALAVCLDTEPEAFFVAEVDGRVVGYIFGPSRFCRLYGTAIWHGHLCRMFWRWVSGQYGLGVKPVLVAVRNQLSIWSDATSRRSDCDARIFSVAVHPDYQSHHIGTGLLEVCLDYLRERGTKRVCLEVRPQNSAAVHIYERAGFAVAGRTRDTQGDWLIMVGAVKKGPGK